MRLLFLFLLLFTLAACGGADDKSDTATAVVKEAPAAVVAVNTEPSATYAEAHAAAVAAIQRSADKGHAWNTADALIDKAVTAAADGDESLALTLADEARIQASLAVVQANREAVAWRAGVVSD